VKGSFRKIDQQKTRYSKRDASAVTAGDDAGNSQSRKGVGASHRVLTLGFGAAMNRAIDLHESTSRLRNRARAAEESAAFRAPLVAAVVVLYLGLTLFVAARKQPWSDEGSFASPAWNLAFRGFMGTTLIEEQGSGLPGLNRRTYWNPPLGILLQALSFRLFGFGIVTIRLPSILAGLLLGGAWYAIVRRLAGRRAPAALAALFVLTDYGVLMAATSARYDLMCAAFGALGWALYLTLRERSLALSLAAAGAAVAASGLTHPIGIVYLLGLVLLVLGKDRRRLTWRAAAPAALPFLLAGAAWGLYILQDPAAFAEQFRFNLATGDRGRALSALADPRAFLEALRTEADDRYLRAFGLKEHWPGNTGPIHLKALILIGYLAGVCLSVSMPAIRGSPGFRPILALFGLVLLFLTFGEGQRGAVYLVHILPLYGCLLALAVRWLAARRPLVAGLAAAGVAGFLVLQLGGAALRGIQDTYGRRHEPAMSWLRERVRPGELVMGSTACAFGLGLDRGLLSDTTLGYRSGRVPDWIVVDDFFRESFAADPIRRPEVHRHVRELMRGYDKVYDRNGYEIYRPQRGADQSAAASWSAEG
jgi:4-amino-4-deoxy-L-arabinose transferase-like glycosyltransferase